MTTNYLFPHRLKKIGWIIFVPAVTVGIVFLILDAFFHDYLHSVIFDKFLSVLNVKVFAILYRVPFGDPSFFEVRESNIFSEIIGILIILGGILVGFSREKIEDEFIAKTRLDSLVWAVYVNYAILIFCFIFFYGLTFLNVMIIHMFSVLLLFIGRFYYTLHREKKSTQNEAAVGR